MSEPCYPVFADRQSRLETFSDWYLISDVLSVASLVDSGFFYVNEPGTFDCTKCFYCGLTMTDWQLTDRPLHEHIKYRFGCEYIREKYGYQYCLQILESLSVNAVENHYQILDAGSLLNIDFVNRDASPYDPPAEYRFISDSSDEEEPVLRDLTCKICYQRGISRALLHCGHTTCSCSLASRKCPFCRAEIVNRVKLYFS